MTTADPALVLRALAESPEEPSAFDSDLLAVLDELAQLRKGTSDAIAAELRARADDLDGIRALHREPGRFADGERDAWEGVARTLRARADELDRA